MLERFLATYRVDDDPPMPAFSSPMTSVGALLDAVGGRSFAGGLYRLHTRASAQVADALVGATFTEHAGALACFGYDWFGRQFSTDPRRGSPDDPEVTLYEPGTGEALQIPVAFSQFHDDELVEQAEPALALSFYVRWRQSGGAAPTRSECVGYQRPLFLGGQDVVANLEISDLEVYWAFMGQIWQQVRGLPPGTPITGVLPGQ